jgi:hypothetical protein
VLLLALVDAHPARNEPAVDALEVRHALADFLLGPGEGATPWNAISSGTCLRTPFKKIAAAGPHARRGCASDTQERI